MTLPLAGILVVSLEQAVAAPMCSCRLADAGARVIKIERPEGDFARGYDALANGQSTYFVWLNRGKESLVLDLTKQDDKALLEAMLGKADVFIQNLKPGAVAKLGFAVERLRTGLPAADRLLGVGLWRHRALRRAQGLRHADPGRGRPRFGHRRAGGAGPGRRFGLRHRLGHERLRGDPGGADRARPHRRGRGDLGVDVRRHRRLDDDAAAATRGRRAAEADRPRAHLDRALRRVQVEGRRRHPDFDPERPRMARAGREGDGRQGARRRSELCHQHRAGEATGGNRRQGGGGVWRARRRCAGEETGSGRYRVRPRQRAGGARAASASAPHRCRFAERAAVLSGAGGAMGRRAADNTGRCRRSASTARKSGPSSSVSPSRGRVRPCRRPAWRAPSR